MDKKLSLDELEELISKIPSENADYDIQLLNEYLSKTNNSQFQFAFGQLQKIDLSNCSKKLLEDNVSSFISILQTPNQSVELFNFLNGKIDQDLLIRRFTRSEFIIDAILPTLTSKNFKEGEDSNFLSFCYKIINAITLFDEIPYYLRSLRQSIFQLAFLKRKLQLCLDIIKSVNLARTSNDFFEFSSYSTSLIQLAVDDEPIARSLFEYMLNCSTFYYKEPGIAFESWFITCLTSFAPLLYGKTVHPAVLEYVKYYLSLIEDRNNINPNINNSSNSVFLDKSRNFNVQHLKQIINKFEESSRPIYNPSLPLNSAPSLLRPYFLFKLWNANLFNIDINSKDKIQPEQIYNELLNLCQKCPGLSGRSNAHSRPYTSIQLFNILSQLPLKNSLPFYFLLAQRGYEEEFNKVISDAFNDKNKKEDIIDKILLVFERAARTSPILLKPHFDLISKLSINQCSTICSLLIKSDFLSFTSLWKFVKKFSFPIVKPIIREGIVQIQRRSRSFENAKFIIHVLRHFFAKPSSSSKNPEINWSAVAEAFPDDANISVTILLNESIVADDKNNNDSDNSSKLLNWRDQFMKYISKSPATYHRIVAIPYLLLCSGDNNIHIENAKWAISKLPAYQNMSEAVLEGYSLFELAKHVISQSTSTEQTDKTLNELFGYEKEKIACYASSFAHAAIILKIGSQESMNALISSINSSHLQIARSSKLAINFLRLSNCIFNSDQEDVVKKVNNPVVDLIFGLLSPSINSNSKSGTFDFDANLKNDEKNFIQMLTKAHSMDVESITTTLKKQKFNNFHELREHFMLLAISCFLLLPARSVSQSSTDKCISLLNSPSSTYKQKNFALLALSQSPSFPEDKIDLSSKELINEPLLSRSLLLVAMKTKNTEVISSILNQSKDFTIIEVIKPLLPFLDQKMVSNFVEKTALDTDVQVLFDSLDLFTNPNILFIIFTDIRCRPIINTIFTNRYQKLRSAISKLGPQEIMEKITFTPFDDFALLSMRERDYPISSICRGLIGQKSIVTLPGVFLILTSERNKMFQYADSMFAFIQDLDGSEIVKALKYIAIFYLVGSSREPFETIRLHFEANPTELNEDIIHSLIPSLFARFINKSEHYDILVKASKETDDVYLNEAVQALRLKQLS